MSLLESISTHKRATAALVIAFLLLASLVTFSRIKKVAPVSWGWFGRVNQTAGVAVGGYDPVAYFEGHAEPGRAELARTYQGASYRFASPAHRDAFDAAPQQYLPELGGFCAFAVSKGFTANVDPTAFHIEGGKLYLFDGSSVKAEWVAGLSQGTRAKSDENWARR